MNVNFARRVFYMWHYADAPERYGTVAEAPAVLPAFGLPTGICLDGYKFNGDNILGWQWAHANPRI
jgi:hypothetical protein